MSRRYLLKDEIEGVLRRGKAVECFLGPHTFDGQRGVQYLVLRQRGAAVEAELFRSKDSGGAGLYDIYEFAPLNPRVADGDPDQLEKFGTIDQCLRWMAEQWPGSTARLVNQGVLESEYADYLAEVGRG